jgi:hypothetical protein
MIDINATSGREEESFERRVWSYKRIQKTFMSELDRSMSELRRKQEGLLERKHKKTGFYYPIKYPRQNVPDDESKY